MTLRQSRIFDCAQSYGHQTLSGNNVVAVQAMEAIEELRQAVDALIIIPNDKLLQSKYLHECDSMPGLRVKYVLRSFFHFMLQEAFNWKWSTELPYAATIDCSNARRDVIDSHEVIFSLVYDECLCSP